MPVKVQDLISRLESDGWFLVRQKGNPGETKVSITVVCTLGCGFTRRRQIGDKVTDKEPLGAAGREFRDTRSYVTHCSSGT